MKKYLLIKILFTFFTLLILKDSFVFSNEKKDLKKIESLLKKFAVVNLEFIFKNFKKYPIAKNKIQNEYKIFIKKKIEKELKIKDLEEKKMKKNDPNFNLNILKNQILEIENQKSKYAQWIYNEKIKIKKLKIKMKKILLKEIFNVINVFRKNHNISIIFEKKHILSFQKDLEMTSKILKILNK